MNAEDLAQFGLAPEITAELSKPEVLSKFAAYIEKAKEPVLAKNNELLSKHTELNATIKSFGGIDAIKSLSDTAAKAKAAADEAAARSGDIEAIKRQYQEQNQSIAKERDALRNQIVNDTVTKQLNDAIKGAKGAPALLEPLVRGRVKSELVDGQVKLTVLNANGSPMLAMDGKDASLHDLIEEFRSNADYARAFDGSKAGGSGAVGSATTSNPASLVGDNPWNPATRNLTKQSQLVNSNPGVAKAMAAVYGVNLQI